MSRRKTVCYCTEDFEVDQISSIVPELKREGFSLDENLGVLVIPIIRTIGFIHNQNEGKSPSCIPRCLPLSSSS